MRFFAPPACALCATADKLRMTLRNTCLLACTSLLVLWAAGLAMAQERRVVAVNVLDEEGRQVTGLRAENFRGKLHGQTLKIDSVTYDSGSRRILILIDISDSVTGPELKWGLALQAAREVASLAGPDTSLGLVLFGSKIAHRVEFSEGNEAVMKALDSLGPQSAAAKGYEKTALVDSILEGLELFDEPKFGDGAFVITDAIEGRSQRKFSDFEAALLSRNVRLFAFILSRPVPVRPASPPPGSGTPSFSPGGTELGQDPAGVLGRAAEASGGGWYAVISGERYRGEPPGYWYSNERKAAALAAVGELRTQIENVYRVEFQIPVVLREPRSWTLEVVEAAPFASQSAAQDKPIGPQDVPQGKGRKRKDVRVVYPRKLAACEGTE